MDSFDKCKLNQMIVLCRPIVKKTKAFLIRKTIRNVKVFENCKSPNDTVREKKKKKAEKLLNEIQLIRKLNADSVIKFGLKNSDLKSLLGKCTKDEERALIKLADCKPIQDHLNKIRSQLPNWESELPKLLEDLGKRSAQKKKKVLDNNNSSNICVSTTDWEVEVNPVKTSIVKKEISKKNSNVRKQDKKREIKIQDKKREIKIQDKKKEIQIQGKKKEIKIQDKLVQPFNTKKNLDKRKFSIIEDKEEEEEEDEEISEVDDSFFVNKRIKISKNQEHSDNKEVLKSFTLNNHNNARSRERTVHKFNLNNNTNVPSSLMLPISSKNELHPSWIAARKNKSIQNFQGTKIKFDDDE